MLYKELKQYFESNDLPKRLETENVIYLNLPKYVSDVIKYIDNEVDTSRPTQHARYLKSELTEIYLQLNGVLK